MLAVPALPLLLSRTRLRLVPEALEATLTGLPEVTEARRLLGRLWPQLAAAVVLLARRLPVLVVRAVLAVVVAGELALAVLGLPDRETTAAREAPTFPPVEEAKVLPGRTVRKAGAPETAVQEQPARLAAPRSPMQAVAVVAAATKRSALEVLAVVVSVALETPTRERGPQETVRMGWAVAAVAVRRTAVERVRRVTAVPVSSSSGTRYEHLRSTSNRRHRHTGNRRHRRLGQLPSRRNVGRHPDAGRYRLGV
jgi:hypothetical protein